MSLRPQSSRPARRYRGRSATLCAVLALLLAAPGCSREAKDPASLLVYAGAAAKPPLEEAAARFERTTGVKVSLVFGGSGYVLSQMKLAGEGDIYLPGSSDYMDKAKRDGDVYAETERILVYLVPAINVQKGNPRGIRSLKDLTRPRIRVAIANPEGVCVGAYAVEILERSLTPTEREAFRRNLVNYTESCEKTAAAISLKMVDAVIGWSVFEHWDPNRIQTVPLAKHEISRIGYIPIAISRFTKNRPAARTFLDFLSGPEGRAIFARHHYFATAEEAFQFIGATKPVGGEYRVPERWLAN